MQRSYCVAHLLVSASLARYNHVTKMLGEKKGAECPEGTRPKHCSSLTLKDVFMFIYNITVQMLICNASKIIDTTSDTEVQYIKSVRVQPLSNDVLLIIIFLTYLRCLQEKETL